MSPLQQRLDGEVLTYPVQDEIWPGESGQGYVLRMAASNGLGGVIRVKQMLGCTRYQTFDSQDAPQLADWFGAGVQQLSFALETTTNGRRVQGSTYLGHVLGRSYFLNRRYPRVCPDCLSEFGYCRAAWDFNLSVACAFHRRLLIERCPACMSTLQWTRPGPTLCDCGYPWSMHDCPIAATDGELFVAQAIDLRVEDGERFALGGHPYRDESDGAAALRSRFNGLSMDGMFRLIYALATASAYESGVAPQRRMRAAMPKAQQTIALGMEVGVKIARLEPVLLSCRPSVLLDLLSEASVGGATTATDASLAHSLLGTLISTKATSRWQSKHASLSQLVLF